MRKISRDAAILLIGVAATSARAGDLRDETLRLMQQQLARQQSLIESQQKQLAEQKQAIAKLTARVDGKEKAAATHAGPASVERVSGKATASAISAARLSASKAAQAAPMSDQSSPAATVTGDTVKPIFVSASEPAQTPPPPPEFSRFLGDPGARPGGSVLIENQGFSLTLGGNLKTIAYAGARRSYVPGANFFLLPYDVTGRENTYRMSAQYSSLTAALTGPKFGDFDTGAFIGATLTNGDLTSDTYGVTPFNAYAYLRNKSWQLSAGLQSDVFSPRIPGMVDQISAMAFSGNPGNTFRTQARVERHLDLGDAGKITLVGAAVEPISFVLSKDLQTRSESNGVPTGETRLAWAFGEPNEKALLKWPRFEVGGSGLYGEYRTFTGGRFVGNQNLTVKTTKVWGAAVDAGLRLGDWLGVQGELYAGQALGNYAATLGQTSNPVTGQSLRSRGGWGEAVAYLLPNVQAHGGFGMEAISNWDALPDLALKRNKTAFANIMWNVTDAWRLGLEGTYRWTNYNYVWLNHFLNPNAVAFLGNQGLGGMASSEYRF